MILNSIRSFALRIPFAAAFKHAAAERDATQTLWVEARARDGTLGIGEGCPREYVTGESLETAQNFVGTNLPDWLATICDLDALADWTARHRGDIDANPAAWTAIELALLDLLGKEAARPVESLLGLPALAGCFRYTAVLGDAAPARFDAQFRRYVQAGFRDFKLKLSGDRMRDRTKVSSLVSAGVSPRAVRADANNLWSDPEEAVGYVAALGFPFHALEEPLRAGDWDGMRRVGSALGARIILDESLARVAQLDRLGDAADRWIVNLRVSKMGGLLRSLEFAAEARRRDLQVVVGAHVGETSLLTRAALTIAHSARNILLAQEGAFGTYLLARDIVDPPLMFGAGGVLDTTSLSQIEIGGFQVDAQRNLFHHYASLLPEF